MPVEQVQPLPILVFVLLTTLADLHRLQLRHDASYSVDTAINLASVIVLGASTAVLVATAAAIVGDLNKRRPWYTVAFNGSGIAISVAAGGAVFEALRRSPVGTITPLDVPALFAYAVVNFLVNHGLVSIVIGLHTRARPWDVFTVNCRSVLLPALALFPTGVLLAVAYAYFDRTLGILLLVVPFVAVFIALGRAQPLQQQTGELTERDAAAEPQREFDRSNNEFLRTVSHELRTPLTLIHGYAELLYTRDQSLDETGKRMVAHIYSGSTQLTRLVEDLLDFARIDRGELAVDPHDCDLVPTLRDVLATFQGSVTTGRLSLQLPERLLAHADPARISQVVTNLLENAIKYAPKGSITLRAWAVPGGAHIEVQDEGPGIAAAEQSRLWEKFYRGTHVDGRDGVPGSGIGLAVVKSLVEAQGGTVGVRSTLGQGATFWIELPPAQQDYVLTEDERKNEDVIAR
jgi:signal transduction histidine kinase